MLALRLLLEGGLELLLFLPKSEMKEDVTKYKWLICALCCSLYIVLHVIAIRIVTLRNNSLVG